MRVEELVQERLRAGDLRGAATEAIRGFGPGILRYLRTMLHDEDDVADVFSMWSEGLWRGIGSFEGRSSFRTWAFRIAYTSALSFYDQAHRRRERRLLTREASAIAEEVRTTVQSLERRRLKLDELRAELSLDEKTLYFLRVDRSLPWKDVAAVLTNEASRVDAQAARKRYERMKKRLRTVARARGLVK